MDTKTITIGVGDMAPTQTSPAGHTCFNHTGAGHTCFNHTGCQGQMVFHPEQKKSHGFLDQMICSKLPKTPKFGGTQLNNMCPDDSTLPENQQLYNLSQSNKFAWTGHLVETMFVKQNGSSNTLAPLGPRWW